MSIPIDVVYVDREDRVVAVDREDRVVAVDETMQPWAVGRVYRKSAYVVELPAGTIARTGTQPDDQLRLAAAPPETTKDPARHD